MLKVMSLNLNFYVEKHGSWAQRCPAILEVIRSAAPDILAFQAVGRDPARFDGQDQAAQLAEALSDYPQRIFKAAMEHTDGNEAGMAVISRLPLAEVDALKLSLRPALEDNNQRLMQKVRFDLPDGPFYLFNAHFSWVDDQLRDNVADALPYLQAIREPALLMGDLNAPAGKNLLDGFARAGWVDAWERLHSGQPGYTFEAGNPSIRIDYAWANPALAPHLQALEVLGEASRQHLSDHLALLVSLDL